MQGVLCGCGLGLEFPIRHLAHRLIAECYSREVIVPGVSTTDDVMCYYWKRAAALGVEPSFKPFFGIARSDAAKARHGADDKVIRLFDMLRCDVGNKCLRLNSDHQQAAYVLGLGEVDEQVGLRHLMDECTGLQDI